MTKRNWEKFSVAGGREVMRLEKKKGASASWAPRSLCAFRFPGLTWGWAGGRTDPWVLRTFPSPGDGALPAEP